MSGCSICNIEENLQYRCNYCGKTFCSNHRLPERHECPALIVFEEVNTSWFRGKRDISKLNSDEINIPDEVIKELSEGLDLNDPSRSEPEAQVKKVVNRLSNAADVSDDHIIIGEDRESKPYDTIEPNTLGTRIEPNYESSPDVNLDGSIKTSDDGDSETEERNDTSSGTSIGLSELGFLFVIVVVIGYILYFGGGL